MILTLFPDGLQRTSNRASEEGRAPSLWVLGILHKQVGNVLISLHGLRPPHASCCSLLVGPACRCPGLLLTCYYFALKWCSHEPVLQPYFPPQAAQLLEHMAPRSVLEPPAPSPEPLGSTGAAMQLSAADAALLAARQASLLASAAAAAFASQPALDVAGVLDDDEQQPLSLPQQPSEMGPGSQDTVGNGSRPSSGNRHAGHTPLQLGTPNPGRLPKGVRLPLALLLEPSLPEHDIAPGGGI